MNVQEYRGIILNDILIPSLKKLYDIDYNNIKLGVSERNICARLALHMENMMREYDNQNSSHMFSKYFADVEYNRMGNGDIKKYENSEKRPQSMVNDLLIQCRDYKRNFLAIEMKRKGKLWLKVFPDHSYTGKPAEVRMGKGKGEVQGYVAVIKPGRILFEMSGVPLEIAQEAFRKAGNKLPFPTKIVTKELV